MNKEIWKFELGVMDEQSVPMPDGAVVLTAQMQRGMLCVWAIVEPARYRAPRRFWICGTGNPMPAEHGRYVATVQDGNFVWHVFVE